MFWQQQNWRLTYYVPNAGSIECFLNELWQKRGMLELTPYDRMFDESKIGLWSLIGTKFCPWSSLEDPLDQKLMFWVFWT